jgi:hypothetical protein
MDAIGCRVGVVALCLAACGDDGGSTIDGPPGAIDAPPGAADAPPSVFDVSGTVVGPSAAAGPVIVIWPVTTGQDYAYKFGDGTSTGTTFTAGLSGDPPVMARNMASNTDFGVGVLALLAPGTSVPEGVLASEPTTIGISARYAIIYRGASDDGSIVSWTTLFTSGLSCGRCVDVTGDFDTWEPVDCMTLVIDTDPAADVCNWT